MPCPFQLSTVASQGSELPRGHSKDGKHSQIESSMSQIRWTWKTTCLQDLMVRIQGWKWTVSPTTRWIDALTVFQQLFLPSLKHIDLDTKQGPIPFRVQTRQSHMHLSPGLAWSRIKYGTSKAPPMFPEIGNSFGKSRILLSNMQRFIPYKKGRLINLIFWLNMLSTDYLFCDYYR